MAGASVDAVLLRAARKRNVTSMDVFLLSAEVAGNTTKDVAAVVYGKSSKELRQWPYNKWSISLT